MGSVPGGAHGDTLRWRRRGDIVGFECSHGEEAVFPRDGDDADGRCKKYLGMVLEGAGWRRGCPVGIPERPRGLVPGPNRSWGETGASVPGRVVARRRRP